MSRTKIQTVAPGSPAHRAGVRPGETLAAIRPGCRQEISTVSSAKAAETTKIQGLTEVIGIIPLSRATITGVSCPPISQPITSPMGIPTAERVRACRRMIRRSCRGVVPMVFRRP